MENLKLLGGSKDKAPLTNLPYHGLVGSSRVLQDSSIKYAPGNFMSQPIADAIEAYDSAYLRHRLSNTPLSGVVTPESFAALDEDSGLPHIDHMITGLLILRTLMIRDGVLPEDPGRGKRKRAADDAARDIEASKHMSNAPDGYIAPIRDAQQVFASVPNMIHWDSDEVVLPPIDVHQRDMAALGNRVADMLHVTFGQSEGNASPPRFMADDDLTNFAAREAFDVETYVVAPSLHEPIGIPADASYVAPECDDVTCPYQDGGCQGCPARGAYGDDTLDVDATRRAAVEANIKQLEAEQRAATEAKEQRDREVADRARVRSEGMR